MVLCVCQHLCSVVINFQLKAFREGFDLVFPLRNLRMFVPRELQASLNMRFFASALLPLVVFFRFVFSIITCFFFFFF